MSTTGSVLVCTAFDGTGACTAQSWMSYGQQGLPTLTIEQAQAIAGAIALLWASAWVIKQLIRFLRES